MRQCESFDGPMRYFIAREIKVKSLKLKPNKALDEDSSLSYGTSHVGSHSYLPPDTSERASP